MKKLLAILLVLSTYAVAEENQANPDCDNVSIDTMGLAWDLSGKLFTGTVICDKGYAIITIPYINGKKQGTEITRHAKSSYVTTRKFRNGTAYEFCYEYTDKKYGESCKEIKCEISDCK